MATEFRLYGVTDDQLYIRQPLEKKYQMRYEMVMMALEKGNKPAARCFHTYPSTVRRWVKRYQEEGIDGLKNRKEKSNVSDT